MLSYCDTHELNIHSGFRYCAVEFYHHSPLHDTIIHLPKLFPKDFDIYPKGFRISLVPKPLLFCCSVCVHYNTRKQKSGEKRGRAGNTYHVNDVRWM